jgi:hypothetical protein
MDSSQMLDDVFDAVAGRPRWLVEAVALILAFVVIHFGYSILNGRHQRLVEATAKAKGSPPSSSSTSTRSGNAYTEADQSPAVTGSENNITYGSSEATDHEPPKK